MSIGLGVRVRPVLVPARSERQLQLIGLEHDAAHGAVGQLGDPRRGIPLSEMPQLIDVLLGPAPSHSSPLLRRTRKDESGKRRKFRATLQLIQLRLNREALRRGRRGATYKPLKTPNPARLHRVAFALNI